MTTGPIGAAGLRPAGGGRPDRGPARHLGVPPGPVLAPIGAATLGWVAWAGLAAAGIGGDGASHEVHAVEMGLMTVAMMGILAVPLAAAVHHRVSWTAARGAVAAAVGTFLALWAATSLALHGVVDLATLALGPVIPWLVIGGWVIVEAPSRARARRLDGCGVSRPILPSAPLAHASLFGAAVFRRCVVTCWAPMMLAVIEPIVAVPVTVVLAVERLVSPRPRHLIMVAYVVVGATPPVLWWVLP